MFDFSSLTFQEVTNAMVYFKKWSSSLNRISGETELPDEEYWKNFCKNILHCEDKIPISTINSLFGILAEETTKRIDEQLRRNEEQFLR